MQIVNINNPFQRHLREVREIPFANQLLSEIIREHLTIIEKKYGLVMPFPDAIDSLQVTVNGLIIPPSFWDSYKVREKDCIVIMPIVAKGGDTKQILNMVIMIAAMVVIGPSGPFVKGTLGLTAGSTAAFVVGVGMIIGTGLLLSALTPSPKMDTSDTGNSQVYGWSPHSAQQQGIVVPRFYGTNKLWGNIIAVHTQPDDADDTKEIVQMLVALGQGPVEGIVAGSIQINDQPAANYSEVITEEKFGTLNQTAVSFFENTKAEFRPNRVITNDNGPVIYTTPDNDFDDLEIELIFARGLYYANDQGSLSEHSVGIKIEISVSGEESYSTLVAETITDTTTSPKRKKYVSGEAYTGGSSPTVTRGNKYDIRVTKTSADSTSSRYADELRLGSLREVLDDQFIYPGIALLGIEALATDQISGSVSASCIQKGLIVNVYDGVSWNLEWSDNPAWVLWDIITRPVISGGGDSANPYVILRYDGVDPNRLDLVKFYELAQFCDDDDVPDGEGGLERRIRFNGGFDTGTTVWGAMQKICEIARCSVILQGTTYTLAIDKADTAVLAFNVSNIIADSFQKIYLPQSELISEIEVQYRDELQDYERVPFSVDNPNITTGIKTTLELFGITKQSEAWRAAMFRLGQNEYLKTTVKFDVDIDALACNVGDVIYVQHDVPQWGIGGRVVSASSLHVITDRDLTYESGQSYSILVQKSADDALNERTISSCYNNISSINSALNEITIAGDYTDEYKDGDTIRITNSTNNDGDYVVSGDSVGDSNSTTIAIEGILSSAVEDGGVFNLRRVVVTSVFKDANLVESSPVEDDKFHFGILNTDLRKFRVIHISRNGEQAATITAIDYNEAIYAYDGTTPNNPITGYTAPPSAQQLILPPTLNDLHAYYPPSIIENGLTIDIPLTTNLQWNSDTPSAGYVSWSKTDGVNPILIRYKGTTYEVAVGNGNNTYIYWDVASPTALQKTNTLTTAIGAGKWVMCYNDGGTADWRTPFRVMHVGLLQADTLSAISANLGTITSGTITLSLGGDTRLRIDSSGIYVSNNAGGAWSQVIKNDSGTVKMYADILTAGQIVTAMIADAAVSVTGSAFTEAETDWIWDTITTIQTVSNIVGTGQTFKIWADFWMYVGTGTGAYHQIYVYRGVTEIYDSGSILDNVATAHWKHVSAIFTDAPAAGTYTYYLKIVGTESKATAARCRSLIVEELKK